MSSPTFIWCFLMPSIHIFSLLSNILCIVVFASKTFVKKPIAIYFISLLISDSMTLLIGYIEMIDRESNMIDKSSWLCTVNEKIIHRLVDSVYSFMERYCLEWMLYKVLWTRASTILLAILSIQRSRTFFSLAYHERRSCAFSACIVSVLIAMIVTCLEWIYVQCGRVGSEPMYLEILHEILNRNRTKNFYSNMLHQQNQTSHIDYSCLYQVLNKTSIYVISNELNCSFEKISSQFYNFTQSLISQSETEISETTVDLLRHLRFSNASFINSKLIRRLDESPDIVVKSFEHRQSQISLKYSFWIPAFQFINSVSFGFNRHTIAIFIGNALPSFIVLVANLLSIKAIYFSKSLVYLKQNKNRNRRTSRLQSDLRAFLVIIIESCSIIMISWGIPIYMTMFHCGTLYVESISLCPKIKGYLAIFLYADLFNSSTNCFLYSLSGELFRRKLLYVLKSIVTCGRGTWWHVKRDSSRLTSQQFLQKTSNNHASHGNHYHSHHPHNGIRSPGYDSYRNFDRFSTATMGNSHSYLSSQENHQFNSKNYPPQRPRVYSNNLSDTGSVSIRQTSDEDGSAGVSLCDLNSDGGVSSSIRQLNQNKQSSKKMKKHFWNRMKAFDTNKSKHRGREAIKRTSLVITADSSHIKLQRNLSCFKQRTTSDPASP